MAEAYLVDAVRTPVGRRGRAGPAGRPARPGRRDPRLVPGAGGPERAAGRPQRGGARPGPGGAARRRVRLDRPAAKRRCAAGRGAGHGDGRRAARAVAVVAGRDGRRRDHGPWLRGIPVGGRGPGHPGAAVRGGPGQGPGTDQHRQLRPAGAGPGDRRAAGQPARRIPVPVPDRGRRHGVRLAVRPAHPGRPGPGQVAAGGRSLLWSQETIRVGSTRKPTRLRAPCAT